MYQNYLKRIFDIIVSLILLPFFLLISIPLALIIKFDSPGPIFFKQKRGGKNGRYFEILKFRTMTICPESEKKGFEPGENKRITKIGAILRKTKLDETPQIINVLIGDMSIVGPRPEVKKYIDIYPERWAKVLSVRPGITDPASIEFRNEEEILSSSNDPERKYIEEIMPKKLAIYEKYTSEISFFSDLDVIFRTIFSVLFRWS